MLEIGCELTIQGALQQQHILSGLRAWIGHSIGILLPLEIAICHPPQDMKGISILQQVPFPLLPPWLLNLWIEILVK